MKQRGAESFCSTRNDRQQFDKYFDRDEKRKMRRYYIICVCAIMLLSWITHNPLVHEQLRLKGMLEYYKGAGKLRFESIKF
jgi:hypothetical protein